MKTPFALAATLLFLFHSNSRAEQAMKEVVLPVVAQEGEFTMYEIPNEFQRNKTCHSLDVDSKGIVWLAMSFANTVISFDPSTGNFKEYQLPRTFEKNSMDAVVTDQKGNAWLGLYFAGMLGKIDGETGAYSEYQRTTDTGNWGYNIMAVDGAQRIWATSHQSRTVTVFDTATNTFPRFWKLDYDHPTAVAVADDGAVWATGNGAAGGKGLKSGGLVRLDFNSETPEYFVIPASSAGKAVQSPFWLDVSGAQVFVTAFTDGFFTFDSTNKTYTKFNRAEGEENYFIGRSNRKGLFAMGNIANTPKTIDVYDLRNPGVLKSYALPGEKSGGVREAMAFDKNGDVWFCDFNTNRFGRLKLNQ